MKKSSVRIIERKSQIKNKTNETDQKNNNNKMSGEQLPLTIRKGIRDAEPKVKAAIDAIGLFLSLIKKFWQVFVFF